MSRSFNATVLDDWSSAAPDASHATWLGARLRALADRIERRARERRAIAELAALDDYMLHDIGLTRADIVNAVRYGRAR
jgi:uncharacterized protein YjiS (DUF1127 family)